MSKLINKYLSKEDVAVLEELKNAAQNVNFLVTCMGLYNHGKSSLLNVLIEDFNDEYFKVADARETTKSQYSQATKKQLIYVDTPGLNANINDDKRVMDAVKESDINIFVHRITTGEFAEKEIEFLHNVKKHWERPEKFIERTIFVLSQIDSVENDNIVFDAQNKMFQQIRNIFDLDATIIPVSVSRYKKGMLEGKKVLQEKSNILTLENQIDELKSKFQNDILATRQKRVAMQFDLFKQQIGSQIQLKKLEISKRKQENKKILTSLNKDIADVNNTLSNMYAKLN